MRSSKKSSALQSVLAFLLVALFFPAAIGAAVGEGPCSHNCDMAAVMAMEGHRLPDITDGLPHGPDHYYNPIVYDCPEDFLYDFVRDRSGPVPLNPNGYGLAYYKDGELTLEAAQAYYSEWTYPAYPDGMDLAREEIMDPSNEAVIVLSHARWGTGGLDGGNHPFTFEWQGRTFSFMHNGSVRETGPDVKAALWYELYENAGAYPGEWFELHPSNWVLPGHTGNHNYFIDSELFFHWIMKNVIDKDGDVLAGIYRALTSEADLPGGGTVDLYFQFRSETDENELNFVLSDGEALYVFRNTPSAGTDHNLSFEEYTDQGFVGVMTQETLGGGTEVPQFALVYITRYGAPLVIPQFLLLPNGFSETFYVDAANTTQPWNGTVEDPFRCIQDGIDAASHGGTVRVAPGLYEENLVFRNVVMTVRSDSDWDNDPDIRDIAPAITIVDGSQVGPAVTFGDQDTRYTVLDGFTVTNGSAFHGGGIFCYEGSPTIRSNTITDNSAQRYGGGVYGKNSSMALENNTIAGNSAVTGGGVHLRDASSPVVQGNVVSGNSASVMGGGVYLRLCTPFVIDNIIDGNTAATGGGVAGLYRSATLTNNTISGNEAGPDAGGGVYSEDCVMTVTNTILWGNTGGEIAFAGTVPEVTYCDVQGGWPGTGNIDADPLFAHAAGGDFHLTRGSPCENAGDPAATALSFEDFEGDPRLVQGVPDMGADEFYFHLYYHGDAVPGGAISIRIAGTPGQPVMVLQGSGILADPFSIQYGDLYLERPFRNRWTPGSIPAEGILVWNVTLPAGLPIGRIIPLQALVGPAGNPTSRLTNLLVMVIE